MIERVDVECFSNKFCGILYEDSGKDYYLKGKIISITKNAIILRINGSKTLIALDSIKKVKELSE